MSISSAHISPLWNRGQELQYMCPAPLFHAAEDVILFKELLSRVGPKVHKKEVFLSFPIEVPDTWKKICFTYVTETHHCKTS